MIHVQGLLIHQLPNETFLEWYTIVHEALRAPDEPGFNRNGKHCVINTAGHNKGTRLNATYRFDVPERSECDARNTAMVKPTGSTNGFKVSGIGMA